MTTSYNFKNQLANIVKSTLFGASFCLLLNLGSTLFAHSGEATLASGQTQTDSNKNSLDQKINLNRADGHDPIGVMADHVHKKGEWMFGYRFMYMDMEQNYNGDDEISADDILNDGYLVAPQSMTMQSHMFSFMWAFTDNFTLMAGVPYKVLDMDMKIGGPAMLPIRGQTFSTHTDGVGDGKITGLYQIIDEDQQNLIFTMALSLPFGSIDRTGNIPLPYPSGSNPVLPYPMQLGSGSFGLLPRLTYNGQTSELSWGAQIGGTFWLNDNSANYRLGDQFETTAWVAKPWAQWVSTSFRLAYKLWGNINGSDSRIMQSNPMMGLKTSPLAQPNQQGGQQLSTLLGVNFLIPKPQWFKVGSNRISIEGGIPVYQNLSGPQLGLSWQLTAGWQISW